MLQFGLAVPNRTLTLPLRPTSTTPIAKHARVKETLGEQHGNAYHCRVLQLLYIHATIVLRVRLIFSEALSSLTMVEGLYGPSNGHIIGLIVTANSSLVPWGPGLRPERMLVSKLVSFFFSVLSFRFLFPFRFFPFCPC